MLRRARSHADRHGHRCPSVPVIQHSGVPAGPVSSTASQARADCKQKRSSVDALDQTAGAGATQQRRRA